MNRKAKALEFVDEGYNISVLGRHIQVTDAMKNYAIEKISKIERFSRHIFDVKVTMDIINNFEQQVDIILKVDHIKIKSQAVSNDMYASIDMAAEKLKRQIGRYKRRLQDHQAQGVKVIDMNVNVIEPLLDELLEVNEEIEEENRRQLIEEYQPEISFRETLPLKVLTQSKALMLFDLSKDPFMIFRDEADNKVKVIYQREDEKVGIIDVEP